jgi:hypothetical protein
VIAGPLTCYGGAPERYALRQASDDDLSLCRFLDALYAVRPAWELAGIARLRRGRLPRCAILGELASLRQHALVSALHEYIGDYDIFELRELAERARSSVCAEQRWLNGFTGGYAARRQRLRALEQTLADVDATERIWRREQRGGRRTTRIAFVGQCALVGVACVRNFVVEAIEAGDLAATRPQLMYRHARRFANPSRDGSGTADQQALIDGVDALVEVFSHSTKPERHAVTGRAHGMLGHVLRDRSALSNLLELPPPADPDTCSAIRMAVCLVDEWRGADALGVSTRLT